MSSIPIFKQYYCGRFLYFSVMIIKKRSVGFPKQRQFVNHTLVTFIRKRDCSILKSKCYNFHIMLLIILVKKYIFVSIEQPISLIFVLNSTFQSTSVKDFFIYLNSVPHINIISFVLYSNINYIVISLYIIILRHVKNSKYILKLL